MIAIWFASKVSQAPMMKTLFDSISKNPTRVFLSFLLIALVLRLPSLFIPYMDIDEILCGLFANSVVDGNTPYMAVLGEKPPLLYFYYTVLFFLFGKHNYFASHVVGMIWMSLTSFSIYYLVKRYAQTSTAFFAGVAYIVFGSAPGFRMLATTGELLMNLPLVLSCLVFLIGFERNKYGWILVAGILVTVAGLIRQQSLIQMAAFFGFLLVYSLKNRSLKESVRRIVLSMTVLTIGCLATLALCLGYILWIGAFDDFYMWVIAHNYFYIKNGFMNGHVLRNFFVRTGHVWLTTLPIWILSAMRVKKIVSDWHKPMDSKFGFEVLIAFYALVSLMATLPGGRFFQHYFLQAFPALCILASLELFERVSALNVSRAKRFMFGFVIVYMALIVMKVPLMSYEMTFPPSEDYARFNKTIGEYIQKKSQSSDKIFVWGYGQGIYYYSKLEPATRFINSDFLTGRSPSQKDAPAVDTRENITPGSWDMLFEDFGRRMPLYVIDTSPGGYHGYRNYPMSKYPKLQKFIDRYYRFEKKIAKIDLYRLKEDETD